MSSPLPVPLYQELSAACRGPVYVREDANFDDYSTIFNGNVVCTAKAVVCPLDAEDVSKVVLFCAKYSLFPSVKAGGYGTAGWAINGDIIVDLSRIIEIDIEAPHPDGSYTSLKDSAPVNSKGKKAVGSSVAHAPASAASPAIFITGKRRREEDAELRNYDAASHAVASFLRGPAALDLQAETTRSASIRRRLDEAGTRAAVVIQERLATVTTSVAAEANPTPAFSGYDTGSAARDVDANDNVNNGFHAVQPPSRLAVTTTAPPPAIGPSFSRTSGAHARGADPFGYLNSSSNFPPIPTPLVMQSIYHAHPQSTPWGANGSSFLPNGRLPPAQHMHLQTQAVPIHPHAFVTFGAGMRQKEIDTFTARNKLEALYPAGAGGEGIPYHVPFAAHPVGSSIMILGGFGFLSRLHGLSIDNLVEVEMVLADGRIVIVNENEYPDLFWAVRGAGPTLGIATRYKARAFPVPVVFAGNLIYRFNRATAPSLIKHFRDCIKGAPRELYANVLLTAGPAGKDSLVVVQMCYVGPREKGQEYLAAISSWDGERCLLNEVDEKSFLHQQDSVAQVLRGKAGRQWFIRSALITSLPDDIINETVLQFADTPVGCTWLFELAGGAIADFEDNCLPKSQREAVFTIAALHQWEMDVDDDRCVDSAEEWIAGTLKPVHQGGPYPCFLGRHEAPERTTACFGRNWDRLKEIKQFYDPNNLFRNTFWPLNAEGEKVDARTHEPPTPEEIHNHH